MLLEHSSKLRVLMITSQWPSSELPSAVPFLVNQVACLREHGVEVDVFNFRGGKNPLNYLRAWRQARRKLADQPYDLVHAQWGQSALLALPRKVPLIVTFHGSDLQGAIGISGRLTLAGRIVKIVSRLIGRAADEVIIVSEHMSRFLGWRPYHVVPCGVDLQLFCPGSQKGARLKLGLPLDKLLVLFGGNPRVPCKRLNLAEKVVERLREQLDVELVVTAGVAHSAMPDYMNACDALLVTSMQEGSPTIVKEALACNLPVVSVDVADVAAWLKGVAGCVLCENDSPECIAEDLASVLRRRERVDGLTTPLDLDLDVLTQRMIGVYQAAMAKSYVAVSGSKTLREKALRRT